MENYGEIAEAIIKHQESIIGQIAWSEASKVNGITASGTHIAINGNGKTILQNLVSQYQKLFGQASIEACKDAVRPLLPKLKNIELPQILM